MTARSYDRVRAIITLEYIKDGVVADRNTRTISDLYTMSERGTSRIDGRMREIRLEGIVDRESVMPPDMSNPLIFGASVKP